MEDNDNRTREQKIEAAILQYPIGSLELDGVKYEIAPPSTATLIMVSAIVSTFPVVDINTPKEKILYSVLHSAQYYKGLGDLAAVLILGAKGLKEERIVQTEERRLWGLWRVKKEQKIIVDRKAELSKIILEEMRPSVLFNCIVRRLQSMDVADFFAITTSLSEVNLLKTTREVEKS